MDQGTGTVSNAVTTVNLPSAVGTRIAEWAEGGYPNEVCGVLVGRAGEGSVEVLEAHWADNLATERLRDRYVLDPAALLRIDGEARERGLEMVGYWHTHPDHPARPSETDRAHAWPGYAYVIVSVREGVVEDVRVWSLNEDRFLEGVIETW